VGLVFVDLECQKLMNGRQCFGIRGGNEDAAACRNFLESISDFVLEALHLSNARRRGVMDEHGDVEIAFGKSVNDVREVGANGIAGRGVVGIVGFHLNGAPIGPEEEVMRGGGLREAHAFFAAVVHGGMPIVQGNWFG